MKSLKAWYGLYVRTFSPSLKWIALISLAIVLLQELLLFHLDPFFPFANELGTLLQRVLLSLIASVIVYLFTVHLPRIQKKHSVSTIIRNAFFKINQLAIDLV